MFGFFLKRPLLGGVVHRSLHSFEFHLGVFGGSFGSSRFVSHVFEEPT